MPPGGGPYSFVFDGQGIPIATSFQTTHIALRDARTPMGRTILLSCYQAFVRDFSSLSVQEQLDSGIALDDVPRPESILDLPQRVLCNAVVANIHLYLVQLLRYIACSDAHGIDASLNTSEELGIFGFSTGVIAATVIACLDTIPVFVSHATEAFRLAFWMGLRAQQHAKGSFLEAQVADAPSASWTLVTFGSAHGELQEAIDRYNMEQVRKLSPNSGCCILMK